MEALAIGFGLGFLVALQLGPMSLFLIRSTLADGLACGVAVGAGISLVDAAYRRLPPAAMRALDVLAGGGLVGYGVVLGVRSVEA